MDRSFSDPARMAALRLLYALEVEAQPLALLLARLETEADLDPRDRHLVRQLVLGCLRWQKRLDWIADQFSQQPVAEFSPWVRLALRLGIYQLFWLDRVPPWAAIHTSVELAKRYSHRGTAGLVNALLRRALREQEQIRYPCRRQDPVAFLAVYYSHPEWLVARWLTRWGESLTEALLQANNAEAPLYVYLNPRRGGIQEAIAALGKIELKPAGFLPGYFAVAGKDFFSSPAFAEGHFLVQDINAGLPVALLEPRPGERILDLCSAPGGKTAQLAMAQQGEGLLVAADASYSRLRQVRENAGRLGLTGLKLLVQDARLPAVPASGQPLFDRILADVPCSATGTLARHPDVRWRRQAEQLPTLTARQLAILKQAFACLRPEGVLVYSTCSLEEEENAGVVERFLACTPDAEVEPAERFFPGQAWAGHYLQTLPGREPGDGCFAARIRKRRR